MNLFDVASLKVNKPLMSHSWFRAPGTTRQVFVRRARLIWCLVILPLAWPASVSANWMFDGKSGFLYDSNISRSNRSPDVLDDLAWKTTATAGYGWQLTDDLRLSLLGELESHVWFTYEDLSNFSPSLSGNLRYRFGLGANAPWIRSETKLSYTEVREDRRSGMGFRQGLRIGKNFTERLSADIAYLFDYFGADDVIFDQTGHSGSAHLNFSLTSSTQLSAGYSFRHGDVISHGVPPRPDIVSLASAFGPVTTFNTPYTAYRFDASTHALAAAASHSLNSFAAIQVGYEWQHTERDHLTYINHIVEARFAISF